MTRSGRTTTHRTRLYEQLTAAENLRFVCALYGADPGLVAAALERVGLAGVADELTAEFSQGIRQRLAIARTMLRQAALLLLDEPYAGLDDDARETVDSAGRRGNSVMDNDEGLTALSLLADPVRWRLYDYLRSSGTAVGRDEAARAVDISRSLASFHLDRMADAGLLEVEYRRLTGRTGRGAGRPAKLYRVAHRHFAVSLPATRYSLAGRILATAIEQRQGHEDGPAAVSRVAREVGGELGSDLRDRCAARADPPLDCAEWAARQLGYEPEPHPDCVQLRNCPFDELADSHRELVCQMNRALLAGLLPALGADGVAAEPVPRRPGVSCCVRMTPSN